MEAIEWVFAAMGIGAITLAFAGGLCFVFWQLLVALCEHPWRTLGVIGLVLFSLVCLVSIGAMVLIVMGGR